MPPNIDLIRTTDKFGPKLPLAGKKVLILRVEVNTWSLIETEVRVADSDRAIVTREVGQCLCQYRLCAVPLKGKHFI